MLLQCQTVLCGLHLTAASIVSREYGFGDFPFPNITEGPQPLASTVITPTKSLCVDLNPPLDYGEESQLPVHQDIKASWLVPNCLTVFVYTKNETYDPYMGLVAQVRVNNTPIGRFQKPPYTKLVDCPPGRENTIVAWFTVIHFIFALDWRPPKGFDNKTRLDVHVTVIREPGVYWRLVANPTGFKKFPRYKFPAEPDLTYEDYKTKAPIIAGWLDDLLV